MDIFSHSFRFAHSYPSFGPRNALGGDGSCDQLVRIKQRELILENRRKQLCYGDKDETEHVGPGSVNRTSQVAAGTGEISNDEDEQASSTGSHSFDEAEDDPEEDGNDLLGGDVSELDEDLQPQDGFNPASEIPAVESSLLEATETSIAMNNSLDAAQNDWTDELDLSTT
ncbi:hypothetical protein RvY_10562 [Ramazzottius varieornatus]|uniref:Uncharacterized protein n=1 Tax=Ramazzottius varieornatus TaxID=947166 RepID=A0A1D1VIJ5_RAMVA|nr:hypothetical protein RvY_10562 [Ramazzottius varieornatus]